MEWGSLEAVDHNVVYSSRHSVKHSEPLGQQRKENDQYY